MSSERLEAFSTCYAKRVTFSEVDALGYAHHSHAAVWCEVSRESYFRRFGIPFKGYIEQGKFLVMRELSFSYREFIAYDDVIEVRSAITRLGRINLDMHYRIDNRRTGKTAIVGVSNMVLIEQRPDGKAPALGRLPRREEFLERVLEVEEFLSAPLPDPVAL
jgi:YbgC/YbaW family acyl-CoA thioester hydrolase